MNADLYQTIHASGAWVDLSTRAKWRLSGTDRVRYLNGQVTNEVRNARADTALHACVTNVKGRIEGDIYLHTEGESLIFDAPADLRETLGMRLERYIIADDAVLEDIADEWQLWHHIGGAAGGEPRAESLEYENGRLIKTTRFGLSGYDLWLPASSALPSDLSLQLSASEAETFRILQRIPAWPSELNADTFPQEAGLEKTTISYTKGCYIGQEILSRIKTTGKMPRELIAWETEDAAEVTAGSHLHLGERDIGVITIVARHPVTGRCVGLGYIRQGSAGADSVLLVEGEMSSICPQLKISALLNQ
jgi:folate-binding protein YgfZ